jgi:putative heme-binding domain-containing protein
VRRYAAKGSAETDAACSSILISAPSAAARAPLLGALEEGLRGRRSAEAPALAKLVADWRTEAPDDLALLRVAARLGDRPALEQGLSMALKPASDEPRRLAMLALIAELGPPPGQCSQLVKLAEADASSAVRLAALDALARCDELAVAEALLRAYPRQDARWQSRARGLWLGRAAWARVFLEAIDRGAVRAEDIPLDQVAKIALLGDAGLDALARKRWGTVRAATPEQRLAEVRRLNNDLRAAAGEPARGRLLFQKHCATCHKLFGEGTEIGPDLTHANRKDRDFLLVSLVDPSGTVRKEYQTFVAATRGGRVVTGLMAAQDERSVTLIDAKGTRAALARVELEDLKESPASLMPDDLYKALNPEELRDLFGYLQGDGPALDRR